MLLCDDEDQEAEGLHNVNYTDTKGDGGRVEIHCTYFSLLKNKESLFIKFV